MTKKSKAVQMPTHIFVKHLAKSIIVGLLITLIALLVGILGYRHFEGLSWIDAYENAAMILSGMGQVTELKTLGGKIFAGIYALFSGTLFLVVIAFVFAPVIHRFLQKIHMDKTK